MRAYPRHTISGRLDIFVLAVRLLLSRCALRGDSVPRFEQAFARYIGVPYALGVESARKGLYLVLKSKGFLPGDEVIMPAYTFDALAVTVLACGLKPVFVDVDIQTYNIDPRLIEAKITHRSKALLITHMFGQPVDMLSVIAVAKKHGIFVIEDCAHACGSEFHNRKAGAWGDAAIFSFNMGKIMPCFGGGMVTTSDPQLQAQLSDRISGLPYPSRVALLFEIIKTLIFHCVTHRFVFPWLTYPVLRVLSSLASGWADECIEERGGLNLHSDAGEGQKRFANLQAAVGLKQLARLDVINDKLRDNALKMITALDGIDGVVAPVIVAKAHVPWLYLRVRVSNAPQFRKHLLVRGVDTKRDDMHVCPALQPFADSQGLYPVAEQLHRESIEIPHNIFLNDDDIAWIARQMREVAAETIVPKMVKQNESIAL